MTFADTQTPKPPRTSPNQPHYSPSHYITWEGDGDLSGLDEDDLCDCELCEWYAGYCLDLRLAGVRRSVLEQEVRDRLPCAAEMLAREQAEALDRRFLRYPFEPWIRWADTGSRTLPDEVAWLLGRLDGHVCRLCGREAHEGNPLHVDHIRPLADGGTDHLHNLWLLCRACNSAKCAQPLEGFLARRKDLYIRPSLNRNHWPLGEGVKRPRGAK